MVPSKEYLYRDRGDTVSPLNSYLCLFLDSQASLEKKIQLCIMSYFWTRFLTFSCAKKSQLHNIALIIFFETFLNFSGVQNHLFLGLAVWSFWLS
jgi:hypothetical protein